MTDTSLTTETWAPIGHGFSAYEASNLGQIRSIDRTLADGRRRRGIVLKTRVSNRGYELVNVRDDNGTVQTRTVHTLMMLAFVGLPPPGQQTRHYDDNPLNNRWEPGAEKASRAAGGNLFYGTQEENDADKARNAAPPHLPWWRRLLKVTHRSGYAASPSPERSRSGDRP